MRIRIALTALAAVAVLAPLATATTRPRPPVVRESFTPLPCSSSTTLGREGCAEQRILRSDRQINALARAIFPRLGDDAARRRFIAAQHSWVAFRRADCLSVSDVYEGGTEAGVLDAQCTAERNTERISELKALLGRLRSA